MLGFLNYFILQWFFIRLGKEVDIETSKIIRWRILKWIVPLTGWKTNYIYLGKKK